MVLFILDLIGGMDLSDIVIEDDAKEELTLILDRARKLKQHEVKKENPESDAALKVTLCISDADQNTTEKFVFASSTVLYKFHLDSDFSGTWIDEDTFSERGTYGCWRRSW